MFSGINGKCWKAIVLFYLLCCCFITANAQFFALDSNRNRVSMPFRFIRNLVIIQLKINNQGPFNFILDTGVGQMLITEPSMVDSINISKRRPITITGFGEGQDYEAYITTPLKITMHGLSSRYVSAAILKEDIFGLSNYAGMRIHGLLGFEFFSHLAVKIDFADSLITVCRTGKFDGFKNGSRLPISIEQNRPYLKTNVTRDDGTEELVKFIVDLGAGHAISLENKANKNIYAQKFIAANLGIGLKGPITGYMGRVREEAIGRYKIKNVISSFPEDTLTKSLEIQRGGNLGVDLLKKFTVIFDYADSVMYLRSSAGYKTPFEHDMSGLEYYAAGDNYSHIIIDRVEPGSPGEAAGLVKDDEITAINFKPVSSMTIEQIDEIFRSKDNRILFLDIFHSQKFTTLITLKRRI